VRARGAPELARAVEAAFELAGVRVRAFAFFASGERAPRAVDARDAVTRFDFAAAVRREVGLVVAVAPSSSTPRTLPRPRRRDVIPALSMTCSSSRNVRARTALTFVVVSGKWVSFVSGERPRRLHPDSGRCGLL
jgi:hypothetical protein